MTRSASGMKGLGAKYGGTLRKRYARIHGTLKMARECPSCASMKFRRHSSGIWKCKSCGFTVAGAAFDVAPSKTR